MPTAPPPVPATTPPLVAIERAVQERAKALALDLSGTESDAELAHLIEAEIRAWDDDHRRGRRDRPIADPERAAERAFRNLARYGPLTPLLG